MQFVSYVSTVSVKKNAKPGEEVDVEIDALVVAKVIEVVVLMMETRMGLRLHSPPFYKKSTIIKTNIHPREPVMICNRVALIYI